MILSNLYLKDFDRIIHEKLNPSYYGRYVDDVLFVIDKTDDMEISSTILTVRLDNHAESVTKRIQIPHSGITAIQGLNFL